MKTAFSVILVSLIAVVLFISCSDDLRPPKDYSTHISGWMDTASANFHGQAVVRDSLTFDGCRDCHAADAGDKEIRFCHQCHAAYPHRISSDSVVTSHRSLVRDFNWRLEKCTACHGGDFAGGRSGVTCLGCHHSPDNLPSSCTTCHGEPPVDDDTVPFGMEAGAAGGHVAMVVEKGYACAQCHPALTDSIHPGPLPAIVEFSPTSIARARGDAATPYQPIYGHIGDANSGNAGCAVYCHSNGRGGDPNEPVPEWTSTKEFTCNSCHSTPPVGPHPFRTDCQTCHTNVDPTSTYPNDIRFINEQLHVNGVVDF